MHSETHSDAITSELPVVSIATADPSRDHGTGNSGTPAISETSVPGFFASATKQMQFEFAFLVVLFLLAVSATVLVACYVQGHLRPLWLAALGGLLGGWTFDAKWFYRVTARGKDDQHKHPWQAHKFFWRMLIPFVAGLIAFATYLLASAGNLPLNVSSQLSGRSAFGICFFLGLLSDILLSRMAQWAESFMPGRRDPQ
jgi:hypothetical protein